jgi:two-component system sensor histidine kinase HydH
MMIAEPIMGRRASKSIDLDAQEETRMFENSKTGARARGSRPRRGKHRRHDRHRDDDDEFDEAISDDLISADDSQLSEEERAYYQLAKRLADRKIAISRQALRGALITVPLLIFVPIIGVFSMIYFGVVVGRKAFRLVYEPRLREKFLQEEVQRRVQTRVSSARRNLEGEHHRSLEQLSASIAHEIRNPITAAKSLVQQMGEDPNGSDQVEYARVAVAELERVEKSISHLLRFAREEDTQMGAVVMEDVLESALETFRDRAVRSAIKIIRQYDADGRFEGDSEQLRRVVINLVGNAIDALEEARIAQPEVRVSMGENLAGTEVWVRVADNGLGIDEDARDQIFDPFYTSREEGTGLGLALCRKIVDNHGGSIEVESAAGEGTEFVLTFPKSIGDEARKS